MDTWKPITELPWFNLLWSEAVEIIQICRNQTPTLTCVYVSEAVSCHAADVGCVEWTPPPPPTIIYTLNTHITHAGVRIFPVKPSAWSANPKSQPQFPFFPTTEPSLRGGRGRGRGVAAEGCRRRNPSRLPVGIAAALTSCRGEGWHWGHRSVPGDSIWREITTDLWQAAGWTLSKIIQK